MYAQPQQSLIELQQVPWGGVLVVVRRYGAILDPFLSTMLASHTSESDVVFLLSNASDAVFPLFKASDDADP
jgi:hypothetical protein